MRATAIGRCLVMLRRIADALDRAYPKPAARPRRTVDFSVSTTADFERGYDDRGSEERPQ